MRLVLAEGCQRSGKDAKVRTANALFGIPKRISVPRIGIDAVRNVL